MDLALRERMLQNGLRGRQFGQQQGRASDCPQAAAQSLTSIMEERSRRHLEKKIAAYFIQEFLVSLGRRTHGD